MSKTVKIPDGMSTPRFQADRTVTIPDGEIPLIDPTDPKHKKVQERWISHVKTFDLSDADQLTEYERVWQDHCDGTAQVCLEKGPDFDQAKGRYVVFVKWVTYQYMGPSTAQA